MSKFHGDYIFRTDVPNWVGGAPLLRSGDQLSIRDTNADPLVPDSGTRATLDCSGVVGGALRDDALNQAGMGTLAFNEGSDRAIGSIVRASKTGGDDANYRVLLSKEGRKLKLWIVNYPGGGSDDEGSQNEGEEYP